MGLQQIIKNIQKSVPEFPNDLKFNKKPNKILNERQIPPDELDLFYINV